MWFVYPRKETRDIWLAQQDMIREKIDQFDGLKLCAIAVDNNTDQGDINHRMWDEVVQLPNDPEQWELPGWRWAMQFMGKEKVVVIRAHWRGDPLINGWEGSFAATVEADGQLVCGGWRNELLEHIANDIRNTSGATSGTFSSNPNYSYDWSVKTPLSGFTVRLHAKGTVRGATGQHSESWWKLGYESMLDVNGVRSSLATAKITGPFRANWFAKNLGVPWHYSGSFYAFRNELAKTIPVGTVAPSHYVEAWPSLVAHRDESACIAFDGVRDLYSAQNWRWGAPQ